MTVNIPIKAAEIARIANDLRQYCGDDEQLFSDMLEGECDLHDIVKRIHEDMSRDGEMLLGIKARSDDLKLRKERIEARVEVRKQAITKLMLAGQVRKLELPDVTLSVRDGSPKLSIVDGSALPSEFLRHQSEANKAAINAAFADAKTLPNWLTREPAQPSLAVRTK